MKIAFFSPMPPAKSGIADYSAALLESLHALAEVTVFEAAPSGFEPATFEPGQFDIAVYQIGNNGHHAFVYEQALKHPGVVVLHEANLHHLLADITIKRGDWDGYLRELEYNGGPEALAYGKRVRGLEVGPDYEGVPMLRRLLEVSRGVVVHSHFVEQQVRSAGFSGPLAVVPHGAWIPEVNRLAYRSRLGIDPVTPLIGIFGFLKPYKRIAESLRAFRRLTKINPDVRMILVGEPHPEFALSSLIDSLDLHATVRVLGFIPIEDFTGYIAACDIILNLRYPTVGESSGTLLRSLGLGKAVIVSDIGSFAEYPDDVCLKAPVDETEEDHLFEYLNLLTAKPGFRHALGENARNWVSRECSWGLAAEQYASFLSAVSEGREWLPGSRPAPAPLETETEPEPAQVPIEPESVLEWSGQHEGARWYAETHLARLTKTLEITPPGGPDDRILEMGVYMQITPALHNWLGYGEVRGCYFGQAGHVEHKRAVSESGEIFECDVDLFDAEKDRFPYPDDHFSTVLCCELLEHLPNDPMHMMREINRILKPGGHLVLTTPNIVSLRAIAGILQGYHPGFFPAYIRPAKEGQEVDARHNREYAPREIGDLLRDAGFEVKLLETGPFKDEPTPELNWVSHLLDRYLLTEELRGDGIYAVGVKQGPPRERYPSWLYSGDGR